MILIHNDKEPYETDEEYTERMRHEPEYLEVDE
jgi:hypothetical protein